MIIKAKKSEVIAQADKVLAWIDKTRKENVEKEIDKLMEWKTFFKWFPKYKTREEAEHTWFVENEKIRYTDWVGRCRRIRAAAILSIDDTVELDSDDLPDLGYME